MCIIYGSLSVKTLEIAVLLKHLVKQGRNGVWLCSIYGLSSQVCVGVKKPAYSFLVFVNFVPGVISPIRTVFMAPA